MATLFCDGASFTATATAAGEGWTSVDAVSPAAQNNYAEYHNSPSLGFSIDGHYSFSEVSGSVLACRTPYHRVEMALRVRKYSCQACVSLSVS